MRIAHIAVGLALGVLLACTSPGRKSIEVPLAPPRVPVPQLIEALASPDNKIRAAAAWRLAGAKDHQAEARAALEPLAADADQSVRYAVAWALGHLRPRASETPAPNPDETPPRVARQTKPMYPRAAFAAGIAGTVLIEILIGEAGEVAHAEVRKSIPELDGAALACVRSWQFEPMLRAGMPRATVAFAPISFRIY